MRKILLVFLAVLLFLTAFIFILSTSLYSLLYPGVYIEGLRESGAFGYAASGLEQMQAASFIKIPEGGVEFLFTPLLSNFLSYLRGESNDLKLEVEIDMEKLRNFFLDSVKSVKICENGQSYSFEDLDKLCRPSFISEDEFLDMILESRNMSFFTGNVTDLAPVYGLEEGSDGRKRLDKIRGYIQYYRMGMLFAGFFMVLVILGVYFASARDLRKSMRLIGIPLTLAGLIIFAAVYFGSTLLNEFILNNPNIQGGGTFVSSLADSLVRSAIGPFYTYSVCAFVLGVLLIIISFFVLKVEQTKKEIKK